MGFNLPVLNRRRRNGGSSAPAFSPISLFAASEPGTWLDPSDLTTLFVENTGVTPVTTTGQTAGLVLDKSKGLVLGSELVTNGTFDTDTNWTKTGNWTISGGTAVCTAGLAATLSQTLSGLSTTSTYELRFTITATASSLAVRFGTSGVTTFAGLGSGTYVYRIPPGGTVGIYFVASSSFAGTVDNVSVKQIPGSHAVQATAASRPILRQTAGGKYYLEDDLDTLNWTAPAGTYTVAYVDSAGTVTIETGQSLSGATDALKVLALSGYLAINRALTGTETTDLTAWLAAKGGA